MIEERYADGVLEIGMGGGAIRMDFYSLSTEVQSEEKKPKKEPRFRVVMTPQGFVEFASIILGMISKLEEKGLVTKTVRNNQDKENINQDNSFSPNFS
jgi:hypothetical protein